MNELLLCIALNYQQKVSEIEAKIAKADIHTTLIANGVITVK